MKSFKFKGERIAGAWIIEQRDVKRTHLLAGGVEYTLQNCDVGMLYVVDQKNGDRLEVAPREDEDDVFVELDAA